MDRDMNSVGSQSFSIFSIEVLGFFEATVWPLGLDSLISGSLADAHPEAQFQELATLLNANADILDEWSKLPCPKKKTEEGDAALMSTLERVRIFGITRTRAYLVGAKLRARFPSKSKDTNENKMNDPFSCWQALNVVFGDTETSGQIKLECAVLVELFLRWLQTDLRKKESIRVKRWLEAQFVEWGRLWKLLASTSKGGTSKPVAMILKSQVLFDLGRASMMTYSDQDLPLWIAAAKNVESHPITFRKECEMFGFCSPQMAAVWAQALASSSALATPLRLLVRPWRKAHAQVKRAHAETASYLEMWLAGKVA